MSYSSPPDSPSPMPDEADNHLQPFFVLHRPFSKKPASNQRTPTKTRPKIVLESPKSTDCSDDEGIDHMHEHFRKEAFDLIWSNIETAIKDVLRQINIGLFSVVHLWVCESFNALKSSMSHVASDVRRPYPLEFNMIGKQLFTGFILTRNVEFVDDLLTFGELGLHLKSHCFHVANLSSADFTAKNGIGGCLRKLLRLLVMLSVDTADIAILAAWYSEPDNYDKPVVVIIDDMERCNGTVLAEFIIMLSEWIDKIPIILIMGVVTTVDAPRKLLPSNALQCLKSSSFMLKSPLERMDAIVEGILLKSNFGFHIGYEVAMFLKNYFFKHDGTTAAFLKALKIACVKHFATEPLSFLCKCTLDGDCQEFWDKKCSLLSKASLGYAFDLPSCKRENFTAQTGDKLALGLLKLVRFQKNWSSVVTCLYEAAKFHKISLLDIFCEALDPDLLESRTSDHDSGGGNFFAKPSSADDKLLKREHFTPKKGTYIAQAVNKVRDLSEASLLQLLKVLEIHTDKMTEINDKVVELRLALKTEVEKGVSAQRRSISRSRLSTMRHSKVNEETVMLVLHLIRDYLKPIESMPFHEVLCFKNADLLQLALIGDARRTIQVDLLQSQKYLHCSCCVKVGNGLLPSMHDTSIMYNLAQEHGDLINLHDWYNSFKHAISSNTKKKHKKQQSPASKRKKVADLHAEGDEANIQARFCRAVTELQITGLLRMQSKRRPDFIQRIAFGL